MKRLNKVLRGLEAMVQQALKEPIQMGAAYSQDLRDRVLAACDPGMQSKQIAELFAVSCAWVRRVKQRKREHGQIASRLMGGLRVVKIDLQTLRALVEKTPDATIRELHRQLESTCGIRCSESAVGMALGRLGFTFKKRPSMRSRIARTFSNAGLPGKAISRSSKPVG
jgi:transposase